MKPSVSVSEIGQDYANQLKRRRAQPGDKWHLDEVFLTINGQRHYCGALSTRTTTCWISCAEPPNKQAPRSFSQVTQRVAIRPRVIITDKLKSYGAASARSSPE